VSRIDLLRLTFITDSLFAIDPESLQLTVTCDKTADGQAYIENFKKACDMLMDLHVEAARKL